MRTIALVFSLILSIPAFACDQISDEMKVKNLTGKFMTITGDYNLSVTFVDLARAECAAETGNSYKIENAATVTITDAKTNKQVQSYVTNMSVLSDTFYLTKPTNMINGGAEIFMNKKKEFVILYAGAGIKPTVTR